MISVISRVGLYHVSVAPVEWKGVSVIGTWCSVLSHVREPHESLRERESAHVCCTERMYYVLCLYVARNYTAVPDESRPLSFLALDVFVARLLVARAGRRRHRPAGAARVLLHLLRARRRERGRRRQSTGPATELSSTRNRRHSHRRRCGRHSARAV